MPDPDADLLKVAPDAPLTEIKRAYRKAALAHHPDQNPDPGAARHFRRLTEAYRILEARALVREPPPRKVAPLADRVSFVLADVRSLVKRWPPERWTQSVDGLPAAVWVASALEILALRWPGAPEPAPVVPTREGIAQALASWDDRLAEWPLAPTLPRARSLAEAVAAAEVRLRALDRPRRNRRGST